MEKLLSIIIPHYNTPGKLSRLLDSIPDRDEIEVVVCDDCSTKDVDKFKKIAENHPSYIYPVAEKNTGAGGARNRGLQVATGKWILFADSDDYFTPHMWEAVSSFFDTDADIVLFMPTSVMEGSGETADRHLQSEKIVAGLLEEERTGNRDEKLELTARFMMTLNLSRLIRRSFIQEQGIRFDETMRYFEDALFAMESGRAAGRIAACGTVIYIITKDEGTETYSRDREAERLRLRCSYIRAKRLNAALTSRERQILGTGPQLVRQRRRQYYKYMIKRTLYPVYRLIKK